MMVGKQFMRLILPKDIAGKGRVFRSDGKENNKKSFEA